MTTPTDTLEHRLARIESRLCQLMLHFGMDPNKREYDAPNPNFHREQVNTKARVWRFGNK